MVKVETNGDKWTKIIRKWKKFKETMAKDTKKNGQKMLNSTMVKVTINQ